MIIIIRVQGKTKMNATINIFLYYVELNFLPPQKIKFNAILTYISQ